MDLSGQALASIDHVCVYLPGSNRAPITIQGRRVVQVAVGAVPIVRTLTEDGRAHDYVGMPFEIVMMSSSIVSPGPNIIPPRAA